MITKIANGRLISGGAICDGKSLYLRDGVIDAITSDKQPYDRLIDAEGCYVSAGFIDIHTHGGGGFDFMDGGTAPIFGAMRAHLAHGTTTIFPTGLTSSREVISGFLRDVQAADATHAEDLPHIGGIHLEGPYFAPAQAGAQNPAYLRCPDPEEYEDWIRIGGSLLRRISFAPELPGTVALCDALRRHGIVAAMAHSDAIYEDILPAYQHGCKLVTHLYSTMTGVVRRNAYRKLGMVETTFLLQDMDAEIIADGCHLPPELLKMIYQIKGAGHLALVTDSMRGAGMPDGPSVLGRTAEGVPCVIEDGVAKMPDRKAFAGSVATTDRLVRVMYHQAGVPLAECIRMMTETPARIMGLRRKGLLQPGYDADVVLFDEQIRVRQALVAPNR